MRFRLLLLALLVAADVLVLPAAARLPWYVSLLPGQASRLTEWQQEWLHRPVQAGLTLLQPQTQQDRSAREAWLWLQFLLALPALAVLWPGAGTPHSRARGVPPADPSGAHGTARWRSGRELAATLAPVRIGRRHPPPGLLAGVIPAPPAPGRAGIRPAASWHRTATAYLVSGPDTPSPVNPHVLVLGSTGSGKTRRLVLPNLWLLGQARAAGAPNSIICTDPKGELYRTTAGYFLTLDYQVRTLNLLDTRRSDRYDPIGAVVAALARGDVSGANDAAWDAGHAFSTIEANRYTREEPIWRNSSESLIAATILYVARHAPDGQKTMATVYRLITEYGQDGGELLDHVFRSTTDIADPARMAYAITGLSQDRTRASILTTVATNLRLFADPNVVALTAGMDYDLADIGREPTVVYLLLPDDRSTRNALAAMYLAQCYAALSRLAGSTESGRLPVPTYWILDEFANLGQFREFDKWIAVMRGRGMAAMLVLQALQQLEARYGPDVARVIAGNCDTWLLLRTNDRATAREISDKLGQYTIRTRTGSATMRRWDVSQGTSEHLTGRPLLTPDEVLRWPMGQVLVMQAGQHPARLHLADIDLWPAVFSPGAPPAVRGDDAESDTPWLPRVAPGTPDAAPASKPGTAVGTAKQGGGAGEGPRADQGGQAGDGPPGGKDADGDSPAGQEESEAAVTAEPTGDLQDLIVGDADQPDRR